MQSFWQFVTESENVKAMQSMEILKHALTGSPFEKDVYLVGGAVRDQQLGLPIKDLDMVVDGHGLEGGIECATWLAKHLHVFKDGSNPVIFPRFGTAKLVLPNGFDVEFVAPRKEVYTPGSRKPVVSVGTLDDDAMRRDFTVNALFKRLTDDEIRDLTGRGLADLKRGVLQTTSDSDYIFSEDPLRMIRAVRFAVKYGFDLPLELIRAIKKNASKLNFISKERINDELNKILVLKKPSKAIRLFQVTGMLTHISPELEALVGLTQNKFHNKDAFRHTMDVLDATPPELPVRLAALFHDIGKAATRTDTGGKVQFLKHADVGADLTREIMHRLKYSNDDIDKVADMVHHHMDLKFGGNDATTLQDKHLRKFIYRVADRLDPLLKLIHADNISHAEGSSMPDQIEHIRQRIKDWDIDKILDTKSILDGNEIVALGAKGPLIGEIKSRILAKVLEYPEFSRHDAEQLALNMIRDVSVQKKKA